MIPDDAQALFQGGARKSPVTLIITGNSGQTLTVSNLWILNLAHTLRRLNMRRRVGNKLAIASDQAPVQLNQSVPNFAYWPWSLNKGAIWQVDDAMRDIMTNTVDGVLQKEKQYWGQMAQMTIDSRLTSGGSGLPLEDFQLDDQGDGAVQRLIKYLPEAEVYVDYDGSVIFFSRTGGDEAAIYNAILPEIPGGGHAALVSNAALRPSKINVKFTPEVEVRFDALENANASASGSSNHDVDTTVGPTAGGIKVSYQRTLDNVLPSVDYQLTVNGNTIPMGTYILMDDSFTAWGPLPVQGVSQNLDHPLIQRAFVPWLDLWSKLNQIGQQPGPNGNSSPWVERIAAVQNNYRTTYRLPSAWVNQMLSIRAFRISIIDPQSAMRAPSLAYCDYALVYSQRQQARNAAAGGSFDIAQNRSGYPKNSILDSTVAPAPAYITVLDQDQGIIHINYRIDFNRMIEMILPSNLKSDNNSMPTADISNRNRAITFDTLNKAGGYSALSASFKLATVLTCVPASPNNINQLYSIAISPSDVQDLVPQGQNTGLMNAQGPEMDVHCGLDTARVMWLDSRSADIEAIFGIQNGVASSTPLTPNLKGLVINGEDGSLSTGASLTNLAKAEAAKVYAALADHYEGTVTGGMNPNVHLNGMLTDITHKLDENGVTTTQLTMPSTAERMTKQIDVFRFLNSTSRAVILRLVQPQGGA
jgi:hypothetical protein